MQFSEQKLAGIMSDLGSLYEKTYTPEQIGIWYRIFGKKNYTWEQVVAGIQAHTEDAAEGKFAPKPAHVIAQIEKYTPAIGHVTSDEAWAIALESYDESATVCVTPEILQARSAAQPIMDEGDKIGARMAFRSAYERIMANPAVAHSRPQWNLSLGWDEAGRAPALERAKQLGRLGNLGNHGVLPPPDEEDATPLLSGSRAEAHRQAAISSMTHAIESMTGKPSDHGQESLTGRDRAPPGSAEWYAAKNGKPLEPLEPPKRQI